MESKGIPEKFTFALGIYVANMRSWYTRPYAEIKALVQKDLKRYWVDSDVAKLTSDQVQLEIMSNLLYIRDMAESRYKYEVIWSKAHDKANKFDLIYAWILKRFYSNAKGKDIPEWFLQCLSVMEGDERGVLDQIDQVVEIIMRTHPERWLPYLRCYGTADARVLANTLEKKPPLVVQS
jgi:hypothetical protein